jgi:hypothetical protein
MSQGYNYTYTFPQNNRISTRPDSRNVEMHQIDDSPGPATIQASAIRAGK